MKFLLILSVVAMLVACGGPDESAPRVTAGASPVISATASSTPAEASMVAATAVNTPTPPTPTPSPRPTATPEATELPSSPAAPMSPQPILTPEATAVPSSVGDSKSEGTTLKLVEPSTARYIIREQLARLDFPNDAIGQTSEISGMIRFDDSGKVQPDSIFTVNVSSLTSDEARRDRYLKSRALASDQYPTVQFTIDEIKGLTWPLPTSGTHNIDLIGDLTITDVTRPVIWSTVVEFSSDKIVGNASVTVTFEEFGMRKPRFAFIISVADEIKLELDFSGRVLGTN
ncbi:MAG: YceI family protein [Chloroflexota bacterium]|nr:YceI family protein [Chloroflexota bacterium]